MSNTHMVDSQVNQNGLAENDNFQWVFIRFDMF